MWVGGHSKLLLPPPLYTPGFPEEDLGERHRGRKQHIGSSGP